LKAVAISGSQNSGGSTEKLLKRCLARMKSKGVEGEFVSLHWKRVFPCRNCQGCQIIHDGSCVIEDDDFEDVYETLLRADILLLGAPVEPGSTVEDFKCFLERSRRVAAANGFPFFRKAGASLAMKGAQVSNHAVHRLTSWFPAQGVVVPGSVRYPFVKDGAPIAVRYDEAGIAAAEDLADNLVWLAEKLKGG
jgi:multimeric flavodoxin WrbA